MQKLPVERLSRKAFDSLPEYSISFPTGTFVGKVWKRNLNWHFPELSEDWIICEYVVSSEPGMVGIDYRKPEIIDEVQAMPVKEERAGGCRKSGFVAAGKVRSRREGSKVEGR